MTISVRLTIAVYIRLLAAFIALAPIPAVAQQLLSNNNFETPVTPSNGNNLYATIPNWTASNVSPPQPIPFNVVRPHLAYIGGPTSTPTGGGNQYLDISGSAGVISQTVSIASAGMVDLSGWFSVRDVPQNLSGMTINLRNSSNVIVASASASFTILEPIGLWKQVAAANVAVSAGTYTFEVVMPNPANFDLASLVFKPGLTVTKTSTAYSDLISLANPKMVPGAVAEYSITATSPSSYTVTSNSLNIVDATPANTALVVNNIDGAGSGPAAFTAGSSGLTYSFSDLASTTDDIEFSNDNGVSWTYAPIPGGDGTDPAVTMVRLRPKGAMAASSTWIFKLRYRVD